MFTDEQLAIIESNAPRIRAIARAGTGKTSTLIGYAQEREERMLYLAYNRAIAQSAAQRFSRNVVCKTTHALAFPSHGAQYKHKLGNIRAGEVASMMRVSFAQAALVIGTLNNYLASADDVMSSAHLAEGTDRLNAIEMHTVLSSAKKLWKRMQDVDDSAATMLHDGYLKLYQLSKPTLPYAVLMVDEAQDLNPVTTALILGHRGRLVMVGDPNQAIYGFRGARDALKQLPDAKEYALTQSFRFGPGLARIANLLLAHQGEEHPIVGVGQFQETRFEVDETQPYAYIARTNMAVLQKAILAVAQKRLVHFVGGVESYRLTLIEDGYFLYARRFNEIRDKFLKRMPSLSALEGYAREAKDMEMNLLVNIVQTYRDAIPDILKQLRAHATDAIRDASRVFSTAHKSKGLEFRSVILADDFEELVEMGKVLTREEVDPQQVNLLYVAVTRAMESIQLNVQLEQFIRLVDPSALPRKRVAAA